MCQCLYVCSIDVWANIDVPMQVLVFIHTYTHPYPYTCKSYFSIILGRGGEGDVNINNNINNNNSTGHFAMSSLTSNHLSQTSWFEAADIGNQEESTENACLILSWRHDHWGIKVLSHKDASYWTAERLVSCKANCGLLCFCKIRWWKITFTLSTYISFLFEVG